jgi:hypothetical protein
VGTCEHEEREGKGQQEWEEEAGKRQTYQRCSGEAVGFLLSGNLYFFFPFVLFHNLKSVFICYEF